MSSLPPSFENGPPSADDEHLRALSICHYVLAGLSAVGCCGYGAFSIFMATVIPSVISNMPQPPANSTGQPVPPMPPEVAGMFGSFYLVFGVIQIAAGIAYGLGYYLAGRSLSERRNMTLCYVVAGFACLSIPLGTVLGVFTFIVLARPSVQAQFAATRRADVHGVRR